MDKNENLRRWFADSKVVNEKGGPLVVYHGTAADFSEFSKSKATDGAGRKQGRGWGKSKFYFTLTGEAATSAAEFAKIRGLGSQPNVMPVYLSIQKPMAVKEYLARVNEAIERGKSRDSAIALVDKTIQAEGYDGLIDDFSGGIAVFEPTQIKSAIGNSGAFDPNNPDICDCLPELTQDLDCEPDHWDEPEEGFSP